jgi:hypothetical protein
VVEDAATRWSSRYISVVPAEPATALLVRVAHDSPVAASVSSTEVVAGVSRTRGAVGAGPSAPAPGAPTTAVSPSATAPTAMAAFRRRWRFSGGAATITGVTGVTGVSGSLDCLPASATCSVHAVPFQ